MDWGVGDAIGAAAEKLVTDIRLDEAKAKHSKAESSMFDL